MARCALLNYTPRAIVLTCYAWLAIVFCRMSAQEILEHSFLAVEPDVVLLAADPTHVNLTLQVVFKGMDKLSVKFEFNAETDTAEEVVREMVSLSSSCELLENITSLTLTCPLDRRTSTTR